MSPRQPRLVGEQRREVAADLARRYEEGASIRALADQDDRSYGLVQKLLREAGVEFRARGGADPASPRTRAERDAARAGEPPIRDETGPTTDEVEEARQRCRRAEKRVRKARRRLRRLTKEGAAKSRRKKARRKLRKREAKLERARRRLARLEDRG